MHFAGGVNKTKHNRRQNRHRVLLIVDVSQRKMGIYVVRKFLVANLNYSRLVALIK